MAKVMIETSLNLFDLEQAKDEIEQLIKLVSQRDSTIDAGLSVSQFLNFIFQKKTGDFLRWVMATIDHDREFTLGEVVPASGLKPGRSFDAKFMAILRVAKRKGLENRIILQLNSKQPSERFSDKRLKLADGVYDEIIEILDRGDE